MTETRENFWDLIEDHNICMVTTNDGGKLRSRPMAPRVDREAGVIHFLTESGTPKLDELHHDNDLAINFSDPSDYCFASVSGRGVVSRDRALIKKLWGRYCEIWFEGDEDTADVAVISVSPEQAEYWDNTSGKIRTAYEMAKSYFTDQQPDVGDNRKVNF